VQTALHQILGIGGGLQKNTFQASYMLDESKIVNVPAAGVFIIGHKKVRNNCC
jgi:hypothetical protein